MKAASCRQRNFLIRVHFTAEAEFHVERQSSDNNAIDDSISTNTERRQQPTATTPNHGDAADAAITENHNGTAVINDDLNNKAGIFQTLSLCRVLPF